MPPGLEYVEDSPIKGQSNIPVNGFWGIREDPDAGGRRVDPARAGDRRDELMAEHMVEPAEDTQDQAGGTRERLRRIDVTDFLLRYGILLVWLLIVIVFSILRPTTFFTFGNLGTIAGSQAVLVFVSLALLPTLIAGEFDVSVSSVTGISLVLIGWLNVLHHWPIGLAIAVALGVGLCVGAVNAFFVVVTQVPSIIVTLGMGTLLIGVTVGINSLSTGGISPGLVNAAHDNVLGLPLAFYYGVLATALFWYVLSHTPLGRYLYFVGASRNVARLSGLPVSGIRAGAFVVGSVMSALAGVLLAGWISASDPNVGPTFLLPAFAAAFLGSSVFEPGRFNPWGTFVAVYFLVTGVTGLELLGVAGWIEQVFYGASLILAVAISRFAARRRLAV
jgi:ribose transport system permease protein